MNRFNHYSLLFGGSLCLLITVWLLTGTSLAHQTKPTTNVREEAYRANNIGVALLEQFKHKEAADTFRRALQLEPTLTLARINLGIALFNLPDLPGAQKELQSIIASNPSAPQPHYLLGLIAKLQNRPEDAISAFQRVLKIDPNDVGANINLGQIYAQQRKYPEAITVLRTALAAEPYNTTALYNLGTSLMRAGQRPEGQKVINQFQELRQRGSGTTLGNNYLEQGRYAEAIVSTGAEPELVDKTDPAITFTDATATVLGAAAKSASVASLGNPLKTVDLDDGSKTELARSLSGNVTLFDFDLDNDLDLFWTSPTAQHLCRNDAGKFTDITEQSGLNAKFSGMGVGAVAGDYDNDSKPDLFVIRFGSLALYHNDGAGKFSDVTAAAGIPAYPYLPSSVAFVDVDHDGDLDIFIAGLANLAKTSKSGEPITFPDDFENAPDILLRNDGNGKFSNQTEAAKLSNPGHSSALVPTDFNNRRDIDLLVVRHGNAPKLFSNQRDGSFRDVADETGLNTRGRWTSAAAGDVNKDGYTDFFFGREDGPALFAISDGREKFKSVPAPQGSDAVRAAQFLDYDNDGLLDCVAITHDGLKIWRNLGTSWNDVSARSISKEIASEVSPSSRLLNSGDIDSDGDVDLIFLSSSGELRVARNDGGNANPAVRVNLAGKVSNRSGVGAKVELRAGSLAQKLEVYSASPAPAPADLIVGLGKRKSADVVRVLWPAGIVQAETQIAESRGNTLSVTELDRKPSSCPYLYVWNGERFEFVTDFMGGGEMGHLEAPGVFNTPDPDEYVRIRGDQLKERNGHYEVRVTNELEEAVFLDRLQLIAVAHPEAVEVYPNEGLKAPPLAPFKLYSTRSARPPVSAIDDHGHDVVSRITHLDRDYPDDFRLQNIRGFADEHSLTMRLFEEKSNVQRPKSNVRLSTSAHDVGGRDSNRAKQTLDIGRWTLDDGERILLLLTGWTDYAWSSDNLAASHSGRSLKTPALQVKDARGRWRTVIENIGIPVGRPQTVAVDLTGKFLSSNREVRIVTNMRIYWDQILVDTSPGNFPLQMTRLKPAIASLRWRGFSREFSMDGRQPLGYDYEQISFTSPWKVMTGRYTREGDIRELLLKSDDMFVISKPGDEISLSFDANALPPLPRGWSRTFLLYADGFSKEMDINSASPDQVGPLPFHGMSKYPYSSLERYPMTEARRRYLEKYNTRLVTSPVPAIESELIGRFLPR
ncbi:MAG TPA: FG-GAP-like repeat-containing protein [Pyrinomonadaceae bacterium]|nr:FG-GAP-like repeat-containing protein [Pyrinomonadaceae bacterium]